MKFTIKGQRASFNEIWARTVSRERFIEKWVNGVWLHLEETERRDQLGKAWDIMVQQEVEIIENIIPESLIAAADNASGALETLDNEMEKFIAKPKRNGRKNRSIQEAAAEPEAGEVGSGSTGDTEQQPGADS